MELSRKPFQGLCNIIQFNWHFYVLGSIFVAILLFTKHTLPSCIQPIILWLSIAAGSTIVVSLLISFYVYDFSDLYELNWLPNCNNKKVLNINAGFDETSAIIKAKFSDVELTICDFYNPETHTEISIKRARRAYPPHANTIKVSTDKLPFEDGSLDYAMAIFAIHEIRNEQERAIFFAEIKRITKPDSQIFVTEHLRDCHNFIAYTIGFFHFHSKRKWLSTFSQSNLCVKAEVKNTPFVTTFILEHAKTTL